jgi:hypothetical protein
LKDQEFVTVAGYPDQRPFYGSTNTLRQAVNTTSAGVPSATGTQQINAIKMVNSKGGYNWSATAQLTKNFSQGISVMAAYTRSDQRNFGDQSGDQLLNLWSLPATQGNPNNASLSYSSNLNPSRVIASVSYRKEYLRNLATSFSLFYEGANQGRYSYVYNGDFNRDGVSGNDLMYIPRDASEVTFSGDLVITTAGQPTKTYTPAQQSQILMDFIEQDKYLREHKGEVAKRNGAVLPWRNQVDFKLAQEVFRNVGKTKNSFQFTVDIFNFGNLLNRKWGTFEFQNSSSILVPQNTTSISATTKPTYKLFTTNGDVIRNSFGTSQAITSTYYMQFGVRYNFQ